MIDTFKEIWQTLCTNKLRTILTGMAVAWGIFMLILLLAISQGVINSTQKWQSKSDKYRISVYQGRTSMPYQGFKEGRTIQLRNRNIDAINSSGCNIITGVEPSYSFTSTISTPTDYIASVAVNAVQTKFIDGSHQLLAGRLINDADVKNTRKVILLKKEHATQLFGSVENAVGKNVVINSLTFTVIGVFHHDWDNAALIPYTTGRAINGFDDEVHQLDVLLSHDITSDKQSARAARAVRESIARQEQFNPDDKNAVWVFDQFEQFTRSLMANDILRTTMWVIGLLTLITGIVGVSNIMFVSVRERTHEIGIRRALGAPPRRILTQVILESVVLTTFFGYIGIVLGTIVTEIVKKAFADSQFLLNPSVDLSIALEVTIVLIVSGALAGFFPARRALKVKPVEALREE